jgi:hypothetical protein
VPGRPTPEELREKRLGVESKTSENRAVQAIIGFLFPKRLHRLAYFLRLVVFNCCLVLILAYRHANDVGIIASVVVSLYAIFFILLPRIRDIGMNGWWLIVSLVPVANVLLGIILLFRAPAFDFAATTDDVQTQTAPGDAAND